MQHFSKNVCIAQFLYHAYWSQSKPVRHLLTITKEVYTMTCSTSSTGGEKEHSWPFGQSKIIAQVLR